MVESLYYGDIVAKGSIRKDLNHEENLIMGAMGLAGEAGEIVDELKKVLFHHKIMDIEFLLKEFGDLLWYLAWSLKVLAPGTTISQLAKQNITKLHQRYPENYPNPEEIVIWT